MSINFSCPCGQRIRGSHEYAGRQVNCPGCGRGLTVPDLDSSVLQPLGNVVPEAPPLPSPRVSDKVLPSLPFRPAIAPRAKVAASPRPQTIPQGRKMKYGYWIAMLGLVVFVAVTFAGAGLRLRGPVALLVVQYALLVMAGSFWLRTAMVAVEKGYHVLVGIVLGLFSPLGLLILTLLPDYSSPD